MEEDRASRSRVSNVCGRAEREEQGGEHRRMAEQARGKIRNVRRRKRSSYDSVHVRNVRSFCALWYTRLLSYPTTYLAMRFVVKRYGIRQTVRTISGNLYLSNLIFFLSLASKKIFNDDIVLIYFPHALHGYAWKKIIVSEFFYFFTVTDKIYQLSKLYIFFYLHIKNEIFIHF